MGRRVTLFHSVPKAKLADVLANGLKATSAFDDLNLELRRNVVYCWIRKEDDRMWSDGSDHVQIRVHVDEDRCTVASMDFSSLALSYRHGSQFTAKNERAADLLCELYDITAVALSAYKEKMLTTPEVLVKGDISAEDLSIDSADSAATS